MDEGTAQAIRAMTDEEIAQTALSSAESYMHRLATRATPLRFGDMGALVVVIEDPQAEDRVRWLAGVELEPEDWGDADHEVDARDKALAALTHRMASSMIHGRRIRPVRGLAQPGGVYRTGTVVVGGEPRTCRIAVGVAGFDMPFGEAMAEVAATTFVTLWMIK